jgi:serine/threonine protein kinase
MSEWQRPRIGVLVRVLAPDGAVADQFPCFAIIDPGATMSALPEALLRGVNRNISSTGEQIVVGIGGEVTLRYYTCELVFPQSHEEGAYITRVDMLGLPDGVDALLGMDVLHRLPLRLRFGDDPGSDTPPEILVGEQSSLPGEYRIVRKITEGAHKITYEAERISDGKRLAIKEYKSGHAFDAKDLTIDFVDFLSHHPNLLPTYRLSARWLAEPLLTCSLDQFLSPGKRLDWGRLLPIAQGLATGLAALHGRTPVIVHGDLKPHNMGLVGERPVICDFGAATAYSSTPSHRDYPGTVRTRPPELHHRDASVPPASDVWMLAASLLALVTGSYPFVTEDQVVAARKAADEERLLRLVQEGIDLGEAHLRKWVAQQVRPDWFAELLCGCLRYDQDRRLSATQVASSLKLER